MKKVAILGFGSMGRLHYDVWKAMKGVRVVAVCDKNPAGFTQPARAYGLVDVSSGDALADSVAVYTDTLSFYKFEYRKESRNKLAFVGGILKHCAVRQNFSAPELSHNADYL